MNRKFDKEFFKKLNNISIKLNLKLSKGTQGGRKSKARGTSVEFSDFREYVHGDDFRRVDWNAYGRFGNMALKIAASLSYIAINNLDRVRISVLKEEGTELFNRSRGKESFIKIIDGLESLEFSGKTNLKSTILKNRFTNIGMSILISDFLISNGEEEIEEIVKYLTYKKQQVVFIQILCKEERDPEIIGTKNIIDMETKEEAKVSITPKILKLYKSRIKEHEDMLKNIVKKYGGAFIRVNSEEDIEKIILTDLFNHKLLG